MGTLTLPLRASIAWTAFCAIVGLVSSVVVDWVFDMKGSVGFAALFGIGAGVFLGFLTVRRAPEHVWEFYCDLRKALRGESPEDDQ